MIKIKLYNLICRIIVKSLRTTPAQYTAGNSNSIMCSDSYSIHILSLFFLKHLYSAYILLSILYKAQACFVVVETLKSINKDREGKQEVDTPSPQKLIPQAITSDHYFCRISHLLYSTLLACNQSWSKVDNAFTTPYHYCSSINYNYLISISIHWLRKSRNVE